MDLGEQLKTFSKDSIRLVKRCTKPDAKGRLDDGAEEWSRERERVETIDALIDDARNRWLDFDCSLFLFPPSALVLKLRFPTRSRQQARGTLIIYTARSRSTMDRPRPPSLARAHRLGKPLSRLCAIVFLPSSAPPPFSSFCSTSSSSTKPPPCFKNTEFTKITSKTALGFVVMGFIGFFVKLIFIVRSRRGVFFFSVWSWKNGTDNAHHFFSPF